MYMQMHKHTHTQAVVHVTADTSHPWYTTNNFAHTHTHMGGMSDNIIVLTQLICSSCSLQCFQCRVSLALINHHQQFNPRLHLFRITLKVSSKKPQALKRFIRSCVCARREILQVNIYQLKWASLKGVFFFLFLQFQMALRHLMPLLDEKGGRPQSCVTSCKALYQNKL